MYFEYGETAVGGTDSRSLIVKSGYSGTLPYSQPKRVDPLKRDTFYYYRAVAQNKFGTSYGITYRFKTGPNPEGAAPVSTTQQTTQTQQPSQSSYYYPYPQGYQPTSPYGYYAPTVTNAQPVAVSYAPSSITPTSVTFNGSLVLETNLPTDAWFEWGLDNKLGSKTKPQQVATQIGTYNYSETVTGLNPNTVYYVQAVSENANGISRGNAFSFRTLTASPSPTPVPSQSPAPISSPTPISAPTPLPTPTSNLNIGPKDEPKIDENEPIDDVSKIDSESQLAGVFFSGLLPDSLSGWTLGFFLFFLAFLLGWHSRRIYERKLREKQNMDKLSQIK
jgi:hypothetical protein